MLSENLLNVRCLIGEAEDVLNYIAKQNPPADKLKKLSRQAGSDLASAADLLERMMDELRKNQISN